MMGGGGGVCKFLGGLQKKVLHYFQKGTANFGFLALGGTARKKPMPTVHPPRNFDLFRPQWHPLADQGGKGQNMTKYKILMGNNPKLKGEG